MAGTARRHATTLALFGYVTAAVLAALSSFVLPLGDRQLAFAFALHTLVLAACGAWLWQRSQSRLSAMAYRDQLTSLLNRRAFDERTSAFGREKRGGTRSLVLFDVDGLKELNDNCGHAAGDELLKAIGVRVVDLPGGVFRIGGDEFAVLVERENGESAVPVLRRLEPFRNDFASCGHNHSVKVSYGFASALPGEDFANLFRRADERLRQFKRELYTEGGKPERRVATRLQRELPEEPMDPSNGPGRVRGRLRLLG